MKYLYKIFKTALVPVVLISLIHCSGEVAEKQDRKISMNNDWEFSSEIFSSWFPAEIPGAIHQDLYRNGLIDDPFYGTNEKKLQWIDTLNWIYRKKLIVDHDLLRNENIQLVFEGLDTYAEIFINDTLILKADNMFLEWAVDVKDFLHMGSNILKIVLVSPIKTGKQQYKKLPYELPGGYRIMTRKAAYHYGWDWGPVFVTSGIWKDVYLRAWNQAIIEDVLLDQVTLTDKKAGINFTVRYATHEPTEARIIIRDKNGEGKTKKVKALLEKGEGELSCAYSIRNPKLWWTHNLGDPHLYHYQVDLIVGDTLRDTKEISFGLRTVKLVREEDEYGENFYFLLNGKPVFMKGANYIPQHSFPGTVNDSGYYEMIKMAKDANMNMLRVWGGGIYEKDIFYDLCDQEGILVWQDFMFANAMYPGSDDLMSNIEAEAAYQVQRLKNHPSVALWCGNNEIDEAWHNWGWSEAYDAIDSSRIRQDYEIIFHAMLPSIVHRYDSDTDYLPSSPVFGRGNPRSKTEGDNHYWSVWHDAYEFDWYNKVTGRFMSEFGFQSFPGMKTLQMIDSVQLNSINQETIQSHQKHARGNTLIKEYMGRSYKIPDQFEDFVYVSQLLQAEGIRKGIEAQRRAMPFCMGSLFWQLNDCWPVISWSAIDYSGEPKALYYFAKESMKNVRVSWEEQNDSLQIFIINDSLQSLGAEIKVSILRLSGDELKKQNKKIHVESNSSKSYIDIDLSEIREKNLEEEILITAQLTHENEIIDERLIYLAKPKYLKLKEARPELFVQKIDKGYRVDILSEQLVKNIFLYSKADGEWSENYMDILPQIKKSVIFETACEDFEVEDIEYKCLNNLN